MRRSLLVVALLLAAPLATAQQIYKWKDAQGTMHYSQQAPTQDVHYQQVQLKAGVESANTATPKPASATTTAPAAATEMADTPDNRSKLCATLKSNLATLRGKGPVVMQQNGKPAALDDSQRQQQIATAEAQYGQYCAG